MRLRLIAGHYGGRPLRSSDSQRTHPMSERARGALFNCLGDLTGQIVLDAFAGTGVVGLEAVSRGAARVVCVERDRVAQKVIQENITTIGVSEVCQLVQASVAAWDGTSDETFDLIIADPPYHDLQLPTIARLVRHLNPKGLMILSYPGRESAPTVNGVVVVDNRSYGDAALAFYHLTS